MHSKLENITKLYKETLSDISGSSENWTSFLITASINYKYNFAEQILIFSQSNYYFSQFIYFFYLRALTL